MVWRLGTAIPLTIVALAASACSSADPEPDVSHSGQIDYACALASHVGEDADIAQWSFIGDDADAGARELAALSSLLGGSAGFVLADQEELIEASTEIFMGLSRIDTEMMQQGLARVNDNTVQLDDDGVCRSSIRLGPVAVPGSFDVPSGVLAFDDAGV